MAALGRYYALEKGVKSPGLTSGYDQSPFARVPSSDS